MGPGRGFGNDAAGVSPDLGIFRIELSIVHDREEPQLPDNFYRIKNINLCQLSHFKVFDSQVITLNEREL